MLDGGERDAFGSAVSISGNVAVVGAWNNDNTGPTFADGRGAAYVFRFDGQMWSEEAHMVSPDPDPGVRDGFGHAVSLDGNVLLVGTRPSSTTIFPAGSAYVFRNVAGQWASLLTPALAGFAQVRPHTPSSCPGGGPIGGG